MTVLDRIRDRIAQVQRLGLYRQLHHHSACDGVRVKWGDRWLINFSSNDYLGLAREPQLVEAAIAAARQYGTGSGASRLVTGSFDFHQQLECQIATWKRTEAALAFNSGYQANQGVLVGLTKGGDRIFVDALAHASLRDGTVLSRARSHEFRHNDLEHLEHLLNSHPSSGIRLIVTESVFSMDGDVAPLSELLQLAKTYDTVLVVDEAHSVGVFGPAGSGLCAHLGLKGDRLIQVGTCGKALASFGAYVASCEAIAELLRNRARSFIYTTALPPSVIAATRAAIAYLQAHPERLQRLHRNRQHLASRLGRVLDSQICPIVLGEPEIALAASQHLRDRGFWVQAIRPPTVPNGTARLRISLSASHSAEQLDSLCDALQPWLSAQSLPHQMIR
ncbi:8-amino-7-oxononanoate synthase [Synechococcus sp. PCC 7336]|uniref:8-amino-7-oxononanoate synthase n=1 Tax=Synechococcus sp. PCC 7336 TaxID=195250 RepID=UPI00034BAD35|nr:8-amino-7-oxononanoate synthase [Synechococcus sp. PCC 7336]